MQKLQKLCGDPKFYKAYLGFFADRIDTPVVILLVSGLISVLLAWGTVAGHTIRISRSNPIIALRYE